MNEELIERIALAVGKPLANMAGGCFMPDNGRSSRGECGDGDCYCRRVTRHVACAALAEIAKTHDLVERVAPPELAVGQVWFADKERVTIERFTSNGWMDYMVHKMPCTMPREQFIAWIAHAGATLVEQADG